MWVTSGNWCAEFDRVQMQAWQRCREGDWEVGVRKVSFRDESWQAVLNYRLHVSHPPWLYKRGSDAEAVLASESLANCGPSSHSHYPCVSLYVFQYTSWYCMLHLHSNCISICIGNDDIISKSVIPIRKMMWNRYYYGSDSMQSLTDMLRTKDRVHSSSAVRAWLPSSCEVSMFLLLVFWSGLAWFVSDEEAP